MSEVTQNCPSCGALLYSRRDAFCSECRNPVDPEELAAARRHAEGPSSAARLSVWLGINKLGFLLGCLCAAAAYAVAWCIGDFRDEILLVVFGPIAIAADLSYRLKSPSGHWLYPNSGGKFAYLPLWFWGIFWLCYGAWGLLR
jgi:hypothetical protein